MSIFPLSGSSYFGQHHRKARLCESLAFDHQVYQTRPYATPLAGFCRSVPEIGSYMSFNQQKNPLG
jgi:hypothetical protein